MPSASFFHAHLQKIVNSKWINGKYFVPLHSQKKMIEDD